VIYSASGGKMRPLPAFARTSHSRVAFEVLDFTRLIGYNKEQSCGCSMAGVKENEKFGLTGEVL